MNKDETKKEQEGGEDAGGDEIRRDKQSEHRINHDDHNFSYLDLMPTQ